MPHTPATILAIVGALVLAYFIIQMVLNNGNSDWSELVQKYPISKPFEGSWTEGHYDLGAPSDNHNKGKLGMSDSGFYIEPSTGSGVYVPFSQVTKAEKVEMGEGNKPICYLTLDGDFKLSLPEDFVKGAGDKIVVVS